MSWHLPRSEQTVGAPSAPSASVGACLSESRPEAEISLGQDAGACGVDAEVGTESEGGRGRIQIVEDLHKSLYHRVFCFVRRRVPHEVAEEVSHEVFVRLLRVRNLERMTISVAYLLRIAENLLKRRHERARRYRDVLEGFGLASEAARGAAREVGHGGEPTDAQATRIDGYVDAGRLGAVLAMLTREEQAAVRLIVCEGLDYQSAARSLGVPVSTINNWKHRGLSKLKQLIGHAAFPADERGPRAVG